MSKTHSDNLHQRPNTPPTRYAPRRHLGACLLTVTVALAPLAADAADVDGRFAIKGAGGTTCSAFVDALEQREERLFAYGGWLEGYMTAMNQTLDQTYDLAAWESPQTLALLLANHCRQNPQLSFLDATRMMFNALHADRMQMDSELVEAVVDERRIRLYRESMRRVQTRLAEQGLYDAEVDGLYGETTRVALRAYQEKAGLEVNGLPDQNTLMQLLRLPPG